MATLKKTIKLPVIVEGLSEQIDAHRLGAEATLAKPATARAAKVEKLADKIKALRLKKYGRK